MYKKKLNWFYWFKPVSQLQLCHGGEAFKWSLEILNSLFKENKNRNLEDQRDVLNTNCWDSKQKDVPAQQLPKLPPISEPEAGNIALLYTYTRTNLINKKLCLCRCEWTLPPPSTGATNSVSEDRNQAQDSIKTKEWKTCSSANVSIFNVLV